MAADPGCGRPTGVRDARSTHVVVPEHASGLVLFVDAFVGDSLSWRDCLVALHLQASGIGVVFVERHGTAGAVGTAAPVGTRALAEQIEDTTRWIRSNRSTRDLPIGYCAGSTGSAAALAAAATLRDFVRAIVTVDGRHELGGDRMSMVAAPTLFVVGEGDADLLATNELTFEQLSCEKDLEIISSGDDVPDYPEGHVELADLVTDWFGQHFSTD